MRDLMSTSLQTTELSTEDDRFRNTYSEANISQNILFSLSDHPDWIERIKELENEYGIYIYHAYHYTATYGEILDCLYLPGDEDDFAYISEFIKDHEDNMGKILPIYAINFTVPDFSEFGTAGYTKKPDGGIIKTF